MKPTRSTPSPSEQEAMPTPPDSIAVDTRKVPDGGTTLKQVTARKTTVKKVAVKRAAVAKAALKTRTAAANSGSIDGSAPKKRKTTPGEPTAPRPARTSEAKAKVAIADGPLPNQKPKQRNKPSITLDATNSKLPRQKLKRDRFAMPEEDYALISLLKKRASESGRPTKKNELLRAGLHALRESGRVELCKALDRLQPIIRKKGEPA